LEPSAAEEASESESKENRSGNVPQKKKMAGKVK
jgi:hypothetical protein